TTYAASYAAVTRRLRKFRLVFHSFFPFSLLTTGRACKRVEPSRVASATVRPDAPRTTRVGRDLGATRFLTPGAFCTRRLITIRSRSPHDRIGNSPLQVFSKRC